MQLFYFRYGFILQCVHCFWGLGVKWMLELSCACLYMTFNVCVSPALCPCNCTERSYVKLIAAGFGLVRMNSTDLYVWNSTVAVPMRIA